MKIKIILAFVLLGFAKHSFGQNNRLNSNNNIGWHNYFGTFKVSEKLGLHTKYQFRRNEITSEWQQSLLRIGVSHQLNQKLNLGLATLG